MLEWEGGCAMPMLLLNVEVLHQNRALVSELVWRSLLLLMWLLKNWGSTLRNRWSPKKPETLLCPVLLIRMIDYVCS